MPKSRTPTATVICLITLLVAGAMLLAPRTATAQTRPTTVTFDGPNCFTALWEGELDLPAYIVGSRQPLQLTYSEADIVFMEGDRVGELRAGERYQVVRPEGRVPIPSGTSYSGEVISMVGVVEVLEVSPVRAVGRVRVACESIDLGDLLRPMPEIEIPRSSTLPPLQLARLIEPREEDASVLFGAVETLLQPRGFERVRPYPIETYASGDFVTIDQGSAAGWNLLDVATFYQASTEEIYRADVDIDVPRIVAQGVVFWLQPGSATLLVIEGDQAVIPGTRARRMPHETAAR